MVKETEEKLVRLSEAAIKVSYLGGEASTELLMDQQVSAMMNFYWLQLSHACCCHPLCATMSNFHAAIMTALEVCASAR